MARFAYILDCSRAHFSVKYPFFALKSPFRLTILNRNLMETPQCPFQTCRRAFSTPYNLKKHIEACHLKLKPFLCLLCQKAFPYKHSYKHHMGLHLKCKPLSQVDSKLFSCSLKATIRLLGRQLSKNRDEIGNLPTKEGTAIKLGENCSKKDS